VGCPPCCGCLLCHAPSVNKEGGLVRGLVSTPGEAPPVQYYESQGGDFVRADIPFLRQDFSVNLPESDAGPGRGNSATIS
jgi:hypothetical protein